MGTGIDMERIERMFVELKKNINTQPTYDIYGKFFSNIVVGGHGTLTYGDKTYSGDFYFDDLLGT